MAELSVRERVVLKILAEADHDLYVTEVAARVALDRRVVGDLLFQFWCDRWVDRRWPGSRRCYTITDLGRAQLAADPSVVTPAGMAAQQAGNRDG